MLIKPVSGAQAIRATITMTAMGRMSVDQMGPVLRQRKDFRPLTLR